MGKVLLFGIDGASPELVFERWKDDLPTLSSLMQKGMHAKLESTIPPVTIVAWNAMMTGKDPSKVGVFGYTFKDEDGKTSIVSAKNMLSKPVWEIAQEAGKKCLALYVPLTYPVKPLDGVMVSGFLTPSVNEKCAYPKEVVEKIKTFQNHKMFFDVSVGLAGHKGLGTQELIDNTYKMTDMQVELLKDTLQNTEWDLCTTVMIGSDRLQHALWKHFDEGHRSFIKDSPHKNALRDFYIYLDKKLAEVLDLLDDDTTVIVTSDHGMVRQDGKVNINNWLMQEGYLVLKEDVDQTKVQRFKRDFVDWEKSTAYGGGAYHARIYLNEEKLGDAYESTKADMIAKLKAIPNDAGEPMETRVFDTKAIYEDPDHPECPDLFIYFDNLRWASNPDLGMEGLYSWKTAVGADSAGHAPFGSFIMKGPSIKHEDKVQEVQIQQIAPTILSLLDVPIPKDISVQPITLSSMEVQ